MTPIKGRRLALWLVVGFLLTATFVSTNIYVAHQLEHTDAMEDQTFRVLSQLENVMSLIAEAESESRGYVITGDPDFLPGYRMTRDRSLTELARLETLTGERALQAARLVQLRRLVQDKIRFMEKVVAVRRQQGQAAAEEQIKTLQGKRLMVEIQRLVTDMRQVEAVLLEERKQEMVVSLRNSQYLTYSAAALNVLLLVVLVLLFNWELAHRRRFSEILQKKAIENKRVLDSSLDVICAIDRQGRFKFVSRAAEDVLGYVPEELIGNEYLTLVHPDDQARTREVAAGVMAGNPCRAFENRYLRRDNRTVSMVWSAFWSDEDALMYCVARDNTERQKIDRLKNEFISTVSHELRTPLTSIRGALGLVCEGVTGAIPPKAKSLLDIALTSSDRLVRLINDILDISKIESGQMDFRLEVLELNELIGQALDANRGYGAGLGVSLTACLGDPVEVAADRDRLQQVLANLLSNAMKYSRPGGTVEVKVRLCETMVRVSVCDSGPGVPESFRSRIFQKFAQADSSATRQRGGTGLGLSIAKAIIEKLGGQIGFEVNPAGGSIFYFDLPALARCTPDPERILVVEDDPEAAALIRRLLVQRGYAADVVHSAEAARMAFQGRPYDAVTLDPNDGLSLLPVLRRAEATRSIPVLLVAAAAGGRISAALDVVDWLEKPINQPALVHAVQLAVQHSTSREARVLHVEDDPELRRLVKALLGSAGRVVAAETQQQALQLLRQASFDLVILDTTLPDGSGLEVIGHLNRLESAPPVLLFAAPGALVNLAAQVAALLVPTPDAGTQLLATLAHRLRSPHRAVGFPPEESPPGAGLSAPPPGG